MAREVTHTERGPYRLTPDDIDEKYGDVAVCQCGLSADRPFCDGSHRRTEGEEPGIQYKYVDGERRVVRLVYEPDERGGTDTRSPGDSTGVPDDEARSDDTECQR